MLEIKKSEFRENIEAFAIAVITILFIIVFIFQSFLVKGTSMEPTLQDGERLIVNKFIYWFTRPQTGDIIVLKPPKEPGRKYIKRVIAGPNQEVYIWNSKVYVDGVELKEDYLNELKINQDYKMTTVPMDRVFVMGDNRNWSKDSRDPEVGLVPLKNVVGKAVFIFWPFTAVKVIAAPHYDNKLAPKAVEVNALTEEPK